jgi:malonyl CoA-acyl carrier protein transacylase
MKKIALIFPGQGSQYIGMGKSLYEESTAAKQVFDEANNTLGFDLKNLCFSGSLVELNKTENMLLSILTTSVALFRVYMQEIGIVPAFLAGHSLGEYSALTCSGVISFSDALKIVRKRCDLAQELTSSGKGAMTIINGINKKIVEDECKKQSTDNQAADIACYNSDEQIVIAGYSDAILRVEDRLMEMDAQVTPLLMSPPFHSSIMEQAAVKLEMELKKYSFSKPNIPIISNAFALPCTEPEDIMKNLVLQMTHTVQWKPTIDFMENQGVELVIESGPQSLLTNLVKAEERKLDAVSFNQKEDRRLLLELIEGNGSKRKHISGAKVKFKPTVVTKCLVEAVSTRNRNWSNAEYENGVIQPYEKIQKIQDELEKKGESPSIEQMMEALKMLKSIFDTKKVPVDEQTRRFEKILDEKPTRDLLKDFKYVEE